MKKSPSLCLPLVLGLVWMVTEPLQAYEFKIGQAFPNVMLPSLENGRPGSIADFRGQKTILHIWASW